MRVSALALTVTVMTSYLPQVLRAEKPVLLAGHIGRVQHVRFSPDSKRLVSVAPHDSIKVWDLNTQNVIVSLGDRHLDCYHSAEFSPDGSLLAACGQTGLTGDDGRGIVAIWDTTSWQETANYEAPYSPQCVAFSPDGVSLFAGGARYFVWDM